MQKNSLERLISEKISANGGKIPFPSFMELALYAPGLGYYTNGLEKFGPKGDFVTAPELSPLFGKCISHSLKDFTQILEFGAGTGALAKSIIESHETLENYWILEPSSELQARQKELLKNYKNKITWLTELPKKFSGAIIANEVIDAFPATKFLWKDNIVWEYFVAEENNNFIFLTEPSQNKILIDFVKSLDLPNDYSSEMHLWLKPWIKSLGECLDSGLILILDYGFPRHEFYHPERSMGTLMCHYQHRMHADPLFKPGEQDITAHVDFTALAEAAVENNLTVAGYTSQAGFLLENKLLDFADPENDASAIKMLTLPSEMGELFKVILLTKDWEKTLSGFALQDRRNRL
ncbi:MAG: SAM-dependent methyltransferase [Gammaproteobacteria bacterium]|nr:SAM-dependent methyltransferase [Gammaproteobacteria bacterium]